MAQVLPADLLVGILVGLGMILGLKLKKERLENDEKRLVKIPVEAQKKARK